MNSLLVSVRRLMYGRSVDGAAWPWHPTAATWPASFAPALNAGTDAERASAIQRMLADAAAVASGAEADAVLAALRPTVSRAFSAGGERAWRELHAAVASIVDASPHRDVPGFGRLCAFLEENNDLAERPSRT